MWPWIGGATALAAALTSVPYVYAARGAGAEHHFSGVIAWHGDVFFYLAQMRQFRTALAIPNPVTPEPHAPVFFNGLFAPLGWIAQLTGLAPEFLYLHVIRVVALCAVAVGVAALAGVVGLSHRARIVALLLAMFGAGWRWLVWVAPAGWPLHGLPYWRKIHSGNTLQQAMTVPHLALAGALVCGVLYCFFRGCRTGSRRAFAAAGVLLSVLTSFHPFEFLPLWAALGSAGLILALRRRGPGIAAAGHRSNGAHAAADVAAADVAATGWRMAEGVLWLVALPLPWLVFYAVSTRTNPIFRSLSQQAGDLPAETLTLLVLYGPLLLIALAAPVVGSARSAGEPGSGRWMRAALLGWILCVLLLDGVPLIPQTSHFREGLHLVCAILAAWTLVDAWPGRQRRAAALAAPAALLLLSAPAFALYTAQVFESVDARAPAIYLTGDERAALRWIEQHGSPETVVLADDPDFHTYLAPFAGVRPVRGHNAMTAQVSEKDRLVKSFFSATTGPEDRRAMTERLDVRYVVVSASEAAVRAGIEAQWGQVFRQGKIGIYDVRRTV